MHYVIAVTQCKHTHTHLRTLEYRHKTFFYQIDILLNNKRQCDKCDGKINYVAPTIRFSCGMVMENGFYASCAAKMILTEALIGLDI